jgi:threonine synthase
MSYVTELQCLNCKAKLSVEPFRYFCPHCGGFLEVLFDYEKMAAHIDRDELNCGQGSILRQWLPFLPIEDPGLIERVTLGEIPTPMFKARYLSTLAPKSEVWIKNEGQLPTSSLKDRSMPLMVLKALEQKRTAVGIVSSGNASASLAAYAAVAGLKAIIFLGQNVPGSKLYKTMVYNPVGIQVMGDYGAAEQAFQMARDEFGFFDCNGLVNPYRIEGKKTFSYEVARQLGWKAPDVVLMPTAYGNGIVATWKGFKELKTLGFIDHLPAIIAVQPANCAPIARAFDLGLDHVEAVEGKNTVAEAVAITDPAIGGKRVLETVRESGGLVVAIEEEEIKAAMRLLAEKEGLAVEGAASLGAAAWIKLNREQNPIVSGRCVISVTGIGLNDLESGSKQVNLPLQVSDQYSSTQKTLSAVMKG